MKLLYSVPPFSRPAHLFWIEIISKIFSAPSGYPVDVYHTSCIPVSISLFKTAYFSFNVYLFLYKFLQVPDDFFCCSSSHFPICWWYLSGIYMPVFAIQEQNRAGTTIIIYFTVCPWVKHKTELRFYVQVHFLHCKNHAQLSLRPNVCLCSSLQLLELGKNSDLAFPARQWGQRHLFCSYVPIVLSLHVSRLLLPFKPTGDVSSDRHLCFLPSAFAVTDRKLK